MKTTRRQKLLAGEDMLCSNINVKAHCTNCTIGRRMRQVAPRMLTSAHLWIFALLPLPWLVRAILPLRRAARIALRVAFGARLTLTLDQSPIRFLS